MPRKPGKMPGGGGGKGEVLIMDYLPTYGAGAKIQVALWYANQYHHGK